jgi:diguanylate cyclase (GGDEF)-like protein/PAS domain S-box-containing protein
MEPVPLDLFELSPVGMFCSTADGRLLNVNLALVDLLKYPDRDTLLRTGLSELYVDPQEKYRLPVTADQPGLSRGVGVRLRQHDGGMIWVNENLRVIDDDVEGQIYIGAVVDISSRKQAEIDLIESEQNLRAMLNSSVLAYILIDKNYRILSFNRAEFEGYRAYFNIEIQIGNSLLDYIPIGDRTKFLAHLDQVFTGKSAEVSYSLTNANGKKEWYRIHLDPAILNKKDIYGAVISVIPLSAEIAAQENLQKTYESERSQRQIAEALQESGATLAASLDSAEILDNILDQVAKVVHFDTGRVLILENNQFRIARIKGCGKYDLPELNNLAGIAFDVPRVRQLNELVKTRKPLVIGNVLEFEDWYPIPGLDYIRSWIGVPIFTREELIAVFSLDKDEPNFYSIEHAKQLAAFAGLTALALENARLFETVKKRAYEADTLRQAAAAVINELDLDHVIDRILANLSKVVDYDSAAVYLLDDDQLKLLAGSGSLQNHTPKIKDFPANNPLFQQSLANGRSIILADAAEDLILQKWLESEVIHGWLGTPLHMRGRAIGFLMIGSKRQNAYTENEATLVQAFANEATIALENARLFRELQNLATIDPLTQVYNRRHFFHLAKTEFQRARRFHQPLSAILFDIDDFKAVNDRYGHAIGDQVLCQIASNCQEQLRHFDLLGRYGGEEFMVLLSNTPIAKAKLVAERLRTQISTHPAITDQGPIFVTASFGVVELDESCQEIDDLFIRADRAAYAAKTEGKNCIYATSEYASIEDEKYQDNE